MAANRPPGPKGYLTEEEKRNMPKISKALIKRILSYLKPYRLQFLVVFIAILLSSVIGLLPSLITGKIVDKALYGRDMQLLLKLVAAAFATLFISQIIEVLETYVNAWISQRIIFDMRNEMYRHLQFMPHSFFTTEKQGDIMTRMNSDIDGVSSVISGTLTSAVSNITLVITTVTALFAMNPKLGLVGVAVIPMLILPTKQVGKRRWELAGENQIKHDEMNQLVNETLSVSGSLLAKLFTRENSDYESFSGLNNRVTEISLKEQRSGQWFRAVMGMFTQIGPLLIYLAGGWMLISSSDSTLTVGAITATVALINRLYKPVQTLLNLQVDFTRSLALFSRIFDYLDRNNPIKDCENPQKPDLDTTDIQLRDVRFAYDGGKPVLDGVSFNIPSGSMYAIVGRSGSGKSTIVNLIPRLYDVTGGEVLINGVDVRAIELHYLRGNIGMVTQDTYLFNGTIRENLLCARENATQKELENACKIANIHELIMSMPNGYDTVVGNRGLKLSGGEKQRVSLARVVLKDPKILILDEATSALDSISESLIQDALDGLMKDRTSIVIAHRLSTVLAADGILVIDGGKIAEQGRHEELLKKKGIYSELFETQFRRVLVNQKNPEYPGNPE
ncbi:MAG: ABC transporter ATP-binding protein [Oscillospiraceae bacterium]